MSLKVGSRFEQTPFAAAPPVDPLGRPEGFEHGRLRGRDAPVFGEE